MCLQPPAVRRMLLRSSAHLGDVCTLQSVCSLFVLPLIMSLQSVFYLHALPSLSIDPFYSLL